MRKLLLTVTAAACVLAAAGAAWSAEANVPVTRVTSFSSGVAYFEHNGKVTGDAEVLLKFKTDQINDILKSLVVLDLSEGKGTVTGVSYGSRDPLARALKSFGVDISGQPTLGQLLNQVRGAEVVVTTPEKVTGKILGVEVQTEQVLPGNTLVQKETLTLVTSEGLKAVPLKSIGSITLTDERLSAELNKALALLVESRDVESKPMEVRFTGQGERPVRIGYIAEAPIWKTSYRLVLDGEKADQAVLQGWAIVENTSDFDWEKVQLTLVSGRPISFIQDLYTPLYVPRPVVVPELYASLRPQQYDEGMEEKAKDLAALPTRERGEALRRAAAPAAAAPPPAPGAAFLGADRKAEQEQLAKADAAHLARGVQSVATGADVGELTSYVIDTPVTIPRRKSAMLPIVNQDVSGRKVSIYNASVLARNPLNGLWLTNGTKLSLLAGPVTVFEGGTYAGDARIDNLSPGEKRLLSYAIDLKVTVDPSANTTTKITSVKIVRGVMNVQRRFEYAQTYAVKNKADKKRTLLIEHPRVQGRKLLKPAEPAEQTPGVYRFEVEVPAAKDDKPAEGKFDIVEEQVTTELVAILDRDVGYLQQAWIANAAVPQKVKDALAEAIKRKNELSVAERDLNDLTAKRNTLATDQARVRANMTAVKEGTEGYRTFEKKLLDMEKELETLDGQIRQGQAKVASLRKALEDHLSGLNVD